MISAWEVSGLWWTLGGEANPSTGTLVFSPDSGAKLINVVGPIATSHPNPGQGPNLLQGRTSDGRVYTLVRLYCNETHSSLPSASFDVDLVLRGHHFAALDEIRFVRFECHYTNLHLWLGNRGSVQMNQEPRPSTTPVDSDSYTVSVAYPNLWDVTIDGVRLRYYNHSVYNQGRLADIVTFTSLQGIRVDFPSAVHPTDFYRLERAFRGLVDIFCNAQIQIESLHAGINPHSANVDIFHRSRLGRHGRQDPDRFHTPVSFDQIETTINDLLGRWFSLYSTLEPSLSLFFLGLHDRDINIENVFLGIMQALEAFHRSFFPGNFLPPEEFETTVRDPMIAAIPPVSNPDFSQALRNRLRFANERSLRARLRDLIRSLPTTGTFNDYRQEGFIDRSVATRNSFTHVVAQPGLVYNNLELYRAVQRWQEILTSLILLRIELPTEQVDGAIQEIQSCRGDFYEL